MYVVKSYLELIFVYDLCNREISEMFFLPKKKILTITKLTRDEVFGNQTRRCQYGFKSSGKAYTVGKSYFTRIKSVI